MDPRPGISVVIPAYNEVENLAPLFSELRAALEPTGRTWELVMIDDGSSDGTAQAILAESQRDPRVVALILERNAGQSAALAAGLARAQGEIIVTLDSDLQNDPADLPRLLKALETADVVSGVRQKRQDSWVRLVSSRIEIGRAHV